jgi:hypothetical protein
MKISEPDKDPAATANIFPSLFSVYYGDNNGKKTPQDLKLWIILAILIRMARPPKDARLRKDVDLRIPLTVEQKRLIVEAAALVESDVATWLRPIILQAASEKVAKAKQITPAGNRNE